MDDARAGIRVSADIVGSSCDIDIQNNFCFDDQNKKTQKYGIRLENTQSAIVRFNKVRGNLTNGFSLVGNDGTILAENIA